MRQFHFSPTVCCGALAILCAVEAHCSLLWDHSATGIAVDKAAPYLMGKLKGDNSMV
jgi:hypothetical protein